MSTTTSHPSPASTKSLADELSDLINSISKNKSINLSEKANRYLASHVETLIGAIINQAKKIMYNSYRNYLTSKDINNVLINRKFNTIYGYENDIQYVPLLNEEDFIIIPNDKFISLENYLNSPLPSFTAEPIYNIHWLSIKGIQPKIFENPIENSSSNEPNLKKLKNSETLEVEISSIESQLLTKEQKAYLDHITNSIMSGSDCIFLFNTIDKDPGLQSLLPFLSHFIVSQIKDSITNLALLKSLVLLVSCLCRSTFLNLELYLPQILPALLIILLSKNVGTDNTQVIDNFNDYKLRDLTANLFHQIYNKIGSKYSSLFPRLFKTLLVALCDTSKPLKTHYGALVGLFAFGQNIIRSVVLPCLPLYLVALGKSMQKEEQSDESKSCYAAALHGYGTFIKKEIEASGFIPSIELKVPNYINSNNSVEIIVTDVNTFMKEFFGDQLSPYLKLN